LFLVAMTDLVASATSSNTTPEYRACAAGGPSSPTTLDAPQSGAAGENQVGADAQHTHNNHRKQIICELPNNPITAVGYVMNLYKTKIISAVRLLEYLKNNDMLDQCDDNGMTPLITASRNGFRDLVEMLLAAGADINQQGMPGTALHSAVLGRNIDIVRMLLNAGAKDCKNLMLGRTCLHAVAENPNVDILQLLLEHKAYNEEYINTLDGINMSALHFAVRQSIDVKKKAYNDDRIEMIETLLKNKANPESCDEGGMTALMAAVRFGHFRIADLLCSYGANKDATDFRGCNLLHIAAETKSKAMADWCITNNINPRVRNRISQTPYDIARILCSGEIKELIQKHTESFDAT